MKNLLPRVLWDFVVGVLVSVVTTLVSLAIVGFVLQLVVRRGEVDEFLRDGFVTVGFITLLGVLLVVALYEAVLLFRARGKMAEPGAAEARLLSREVILRALTGGAVAGVYAGVVTVIFALLAKEASDLNLLVVLIPGLLPAVMLIAAGALAYAFVGADVTAWESELSVPEQTTLLALPLALAVTFGFLFGAAAGDEEGVVSALVAAMLTYVLVRGLERLRWRVIRRYLERLLRARGGPTIKVVSTHRA